MDISIKTSSPGAHKWPFMDGASPKDCNWNVRHAGDSSNHRRSSPEELTRRRKESLFICHNNKLVNLVRQYDLPPYWRHAKHTQEVWRLINAFLKVWREKRTGGSPLLTKNWHVLAFGILCCALSTCCISTFTHFARSDWVSGVKRPLNLAALFHQTCLSYILCGAGVQSPPLCTAGLVQAILCRESSSTFSEWSSNPQSSFNILSVFGQEFVSWITTYGNILTPSPMIKTYPWDLVVSYRSGRTKYGF